MDQDVRERVYVVLDGELDLFRKAEIAATLPDPRTIQSAVINVLHATYVDSMVLGMLVQFRREFIDHGGDPANLILILPKEGPIVRAFDLTGISRLFSVAHVEKPQPRKVETHRGELPLGR